MRNKFYSLVLNCSLFALLPGIACAAGTYYTGNYNSPQRSYSTSGYASRVNNTPKIVTQNQNATVGQPYGNYTRVVGTQQPTNTQTSSNARMAANPQRGDGFWLGAGLSHEFANWNFDMNKSGSKLHYDNLRWNVLDITAGYRFGDKTKMQIDAGFKYGMQFGDSSMIDDDISNGGYLVTEWWNDVNGNHEYDAGVDEYIGQQLGHSLSVGNSSSGDMMGFNVGFGLTDFMRVGGAKLTPSVGFRYLKYKLETKKDYGLTIDTGPCSGTSAGGDEIQCDPIIIFYDSLDNSQQVMWDYGAGFQDLDGYWYWTIPSGPDYVTAAGTYMFELPSVSHSYETTWMGPYLALDLDYEIDRYNLVNARFELGLPLYKSTGDQPYRSDWQHPKSVEDEGSFGDSWHIGLGANYLTAITDTVALSLGFTFDYYTLSGGKANTYLNSAYYTGLYNTLLQYWISQGHDEAYMLENDPTAQSIVKIEDECPGWVCKVDNEIESVYKSMGIRVGVQAKF